MTEDDTTEDDIDYSSKLYMVESTPGRFYKDPHSGLVPAFKLRSDAVILLRSLYGANSHRIVYAAPCEFFAAGEVLWDAHFQEKI